jgi:hypothetical protein
MSKTIVIVIVIALAACSGKQASMTPGSPPAGRCEAVRGKVAELYRAEARVKEPARVEAMVADNTRMVMLGCAETPDKVSACIAGAATVTDIERTCLAALDDEGTEGDVFRK